jgi:hypothetical protein
MPAIELVRPLIARIKLHPRLFRASVLRELVHLLCDGLSSGASRALIVIARYARHPLHVGLQGPRADPPVRFLGKRLSVDRRSN